MCGNSAADALATWHGALGPGSGSEINLAQRKGSYIDESVNLPKMAMQDQKVNNETVNQEQSLTLVRNLIRVTISQIAYMRNIFPSQCFEECESF